MGEVLGRDRFGNAFAPTLSYARGSVLTSTEDDFRRLQQAWRNIGTRAKSGGLESTFIFTGLEHSLPMEPQDLPYANDEIAPGIYHERLKALALDHLGGDAAHHDYAVFNRLTGATLATFLTLTKPDDVVLGASATHSHPSVIRAAKHTGTRFIDTSGVDGFRSALVAEKRVALVALTRLATTYDLLSEEDVKEIVRLAHDRGALVFLDDAGGARVCPACFDQSRMLEVGVDVGCTGLDKYGTVGPRLGLLAGEKDLVAAIRAKGFECGLEARQMLYPAVVRTLESYSPQRVRDLVATTKQVADSLRPYFGSLLHETPVTVQLLAEDILQVAMQRGGINAPPIVPYEANAALCMLMLRDYGIITVHFVGVPPGGANLLLKFIPPETLKRFGGADKFAEALNESLTKLGTLLNDPQKVRALLLGEKS